MHVLNDFKELKPGAIRVGGSQTTGVYILPQIIRGFQGNRPWVRRPEGFSCPLRFASFPPHAYHIALRNTRPFIQHLCIHIVGTLTVFIYFFLRTLIFHARRSTSSSVSTPPAVSAAPWPAGSWTWRWWGAKSPRMSGARCSPTPTRTSV